MKGSTAAGVWPGDVCETGGEWTGEYECGCITTQNSSTSMLEQNIVFCLPRHNSLFLSLWSSGVSSRIGFDLFGLIIACDGQKLSFLNPY